MHTINEQDPTDGGIAMHDTNIWAHRATAYGLIMNSVKNIQVPHYTAAASDKPNSQFPI